MVGTGDNPTGMSKRNCIGSLWAKKSEELQKGRENPPKKERKAETRCEKRISCQDGWVAGRVLENATILPNHQEGSLYNEYT